MSTRRPGFLTLKLQHGLLHEHDDGKYKTKIFGISPNSELELPSGFTHFGVVLSGEINLRYLTRERHLSAGDFFSVSEAATVSSLTGIGMVTSAHGYIGLNLFGGPIEEKGRLRYIDGCTDTLLVPPVRRGDACLNHLHFPSGVVQTPHTHPSIRAGVVLRGSGECIIPGVDRPIPLLPGYAFVIETHAVHSFNTTGYSMDVIAFHPDSDTGMTDDDHPMVNRTIIDGVSARYLDEIRTSGENSASS
jgi:quercetin dioxygenase-like cupin family protein